MPHKDPVERAAYLRAYKQRNKQRDHADRRHYDRAKHANQRAAKYGVEGILKTADVRAVIAAGECYYCGATERLTIDHVVPMAKGGHNVVSNLVAACLSCNISKYNSDSPWRWALDHDRCVSCGTIATPHICHGRCTTCHRREVWQRKLAEKNAA